MRLLWVATKPPWPPRDGGRLVLARTLEALSQAGHELTLVAPALATGPDTPSVPPGTRIRQRLLPGRPHGWIRSTLRALATGLPVAVARHRLPAVARAVEDELAGSVYDRVVAEQLHAVANCLASARRHRVPLVLRAQNVEHDLWRQLAQGGPRPARFVLRREAARLARHEAWTVSQVAAVAALSPLDAELFRALAPEARVEALAAPFPDRLPAGEALPGQPALTLLAGAGWGPNRDGLGWFLARVWPALRARFPTAHLHVFGGSLEAPVACASLHAAPVESAAAFASNAIHVVPLRIASGVRMKIIEAWARRVPTVATPAAASGLGAVHGRELLLAETPAEWVDGLQRLHADGNLRTRLIEGASAKLRHAHDPADLAAAWARLLAALAPPAS